MLEISIVDRVEEFISSARFSTYREVPFLHRRIDLVGISNADHRIISIEAKISNWRVAILQARTCLLCSDEVYIAMPQQFVHRVDKELLTTFGIGLMAVNSSVDIVLQPGKPTYKHSYYSKWVVEILEGLRPAEVREKS